MKFTIEDSLVESYKTYITRHQVILDKFSEDTDRVKSAERIEYDDLLKRLDLFDQLTENLYDMIRVQKESIDKSVSVLRTAVYIYSLKFGNEIVVPEGFIEFGTSLNLRVDVVPEPGKITVTVEKQNE